MNVFCELLETPKTVSPKRIAKANTSWYKNETDDTMGNRRS